MTANLFGETETPKTKAKKVVTHEPCPHGSYFHTLCPVCTPPLEKEVSKMCDDMMRALGWRKVSFSQPHRASQTRGISDARFYPPAWNPNGHKPFWFECKRINEKTNKPVKEGQAAFRELAESCGEDYVRGGLAELGAYLREKKIAEVGIR